jgi:hypothetical protein
MRTPTIFGIDVVRNYDQFVHWLETHDIPDLISFDHDLSLEHYPVFENRPGLEIPYEQYKEKTGYHCAEYIVNNRLPLISWNVHSFNASGRANIERLLRTYRPLGECRLQIPYRVTS